MQAINIVRHYNVILTRFKNSIYNDDTTWIAEWFFNNFLANNVTFEIRGSMHVTFPNPPHLSIRVIYEDGSMTEWLHLSQDENGMGYIQHIGTGNKFKKNYKNYKNYKKYTNKKNLKKFKTLRKKNKL